MVTSTGFNTGEIIKYQGKEARVVSSHSYSSQITIEVDGKMITVNRNDLFGMNDIRPDFEGQIAQYDEQIEKNKEQIKLSDAIWNAAKQTIKTCRDQMWSLLSDAGVKSYSQITDAEVRAQYAELYEQKGGARSAQIKAVSDIIHASNNTASVAIDKMNLTNQQYVFGLA